MTLPKGAAADEAALCFDFGGTAVAIQSDNRRLRSLVRRRYAAFETGGPASWRLRYQVTDPEPPSHSFVEDARQHSPSSQRDGDRLRMATSTFEIELDLESHQGVLWGPLATYPIDRLVQTICQESTDRLVICRGAALVQGDRGFVLCGARGSGKTTLASLFPEHSLCDDNVALTLGGPEPRFSALPIGRARPGGGTLAALFLLRRSESNQRRRLAHGEALQLLHREVVWPTFDEEIVNRTFETLFELASAVPVWELAFRPTPEVWEVITAGEESGDV